MKKGFITLGSDQKSADLGLQCFQKRLNLDSSVQGYMFVLQILQRGSRGPSCV